MKTKISFGLVVYNEQSLIRRCLESIAEVADEIILVHDGQCADQTLVIAREYTDKIYTRPRQGGSDPHRIFIMQQAANDWIFMIDADEFLSGGLKDFLKNATLDPVFGAYAFKWPLWNGERYVTVSNYRACLFNRPKSWAVGLHNFSIQTIGNIEKIDHILEHQPKQNKVDFKRFSGQLKVRIDRDARCFLQGFKDLEKFNEPLIPGSFKDWLDRYISHPLFYAYYNFIFYLLGTLKNNWRDGYYGLIVSLQAAIYQYKLGRRIHLLKKETHI
jgi:glycosyltransferase involved in cell wall biosynthesis